MSNLYKAIEQAVEFRKNHCVNLHGRDCTYTVLVGMFEVLEKVRAYETDPIRKDDLTRALLMLHGKMGELFE